MKDEKTVSCMVMRLALDATEEVMGENGLKALLNFGDLMYLFDDKPEYSLDKKYTDAQYGAFTSSWYKILGNNGGKALFRLIGKNSGLSAIDTGIFESFKDLPPEEKLFKMLEMFAMATGRGKAERTGGVIAYDNSQCTACRDIKDKTPVCTGLNGAFDEFIKWAGLEGVRTVETRCKAKGDDTCRYEILTIE
jgi:predicted hydrocarbon binding protein